MSVPDTEEDEQTTTQSTPVSDDTSEDDTAEGDTAEGDILEEEGSDESDDLLELADEASDTEDLLELADEASDADDLMEEAETSTPTRVEQERPTDSKEQARSTQLTRPGAPRTGTGGAATESSGPGITIALTTFVAAAAAIGIVSLTWYRRRRKSQSR